MMKLVLTVTILAVVVAVNVDAAAIKSEEFGEQIQEIVNDDYPEQIKPRPTENTNEERRNCYNTPCGWSTYDTNTRRETSFMLNTCKCPDETYKCVRTGENISISAYVYHCRQNTTADETELTDYIS